VLKKKAVLIFCYILPDIPSDVVKTKRAQGVVSTGAKESGTLTVVQLCLTHFEKEEKNVIQIQVRYKKRA